MKSSIKNPTKLVQVKLSPEIKDKLDKIFAEDGTTTPQALKMIATQIANQGYSPFTKINFEQYSRPISEELKKELRIDELKSLGYLSDDSEIYNSEEELKEAFRKNLG